MGLIWDPIGATDHLPFELRARGEFEYVGRKPLGDGFTAMPVREIRGSLLRRGSARQRSGCRATAGCNPVCRAGID